MEEQNFNRKDDTEKLMRLWKDWRDRYVNGLERYESLLNEKRRLKIRPLQKIDKIALSEYPEIPFLRIEDEAVARSTIGQMGWMDIKNLINEIEYMIKCDYSFVTVQNRIREYDIQIKRKLSHGDEGSRFGYDPSGQYFVLDSCTLMHKSTMHLGY